MVLGYHFIFSAYGFWLPNDPRGSWSDTVRKYELLAFGLATKVTTTHSLAANAHDHQQRLAPKKALLYPPVTFTGAQAAAIATGFRAACAEKSYIAYALATMPDHVHLVIARHERPIDMIASHLKAKATMSLNVAGVNPMTPHAAEDGRVPSPWARSYWCPYIHDEKHMQNVIRYVENNPIKAGMPRQKWSFVQPCRS